MHFIVYTLKNKGVRKNQKRGFHSDANIFKNIKKIESWME